MAMRSSIIDAPPLASGRPKTGARSSLARTVQGERARARGCQAAKRRRPQAKARLRCARMTATGRLAPLLAALLAACAPAPVEHPTATPGPARPEPKNEWI